MIYDEDAIIISFLNNQYNGRIICEEKKINNSDSKETYISFLT